jgi:hypothetical protein
MIRSVKFDSIEHYNDIAMNNRYNEEVARIYEQM